jgi:hypothetical protein
MSNRKIKKVGAPKGNQNARKHGYYSNKLAPWQVEMISHTSTRNLYDYDLTVMRARVQSILVNDPTNIGVLSLAVRSLESFQRRNQPTGTAHSRAIAELSRIVSRLNSGNNHA